MTAAVVTKKKLNWQDGETYRCTASASSGYMRGQFYTCYKNESGHLCLRGSDGLEDRVSMLTSQFSRVHLKSVN